MHTHTHTHALLKASFSVNIFALHSVGGIYKNFKVKIAGDGATGSSDGTVTGVLINVRYSNEGKLDIRVKPELTVGEFKGLITELQNIPANEQRLIYCGQFLQDHRTIGSYGNSSLNLF